MSVVKERLLQTSRRWPAAQLSVSWLPRLSFDYGTYSCKTLDTAWVNSSLFHLCTLCGALGISFGFLLKAWMWTSGTALLCLQWVELNKGENDLFYICHCNLRSIWPNSVSGICGTNIHQEGMSHFNSSASTDSFSPLISLLLSHLPPSLPVLLQPWTNLQ